ncbi:hypothetical protein FEP70_05634 [Burkholderia multivorans]|nr:hypothetical protein [Burkholderia multivorans]MDR8915031.1 hypothetical protein [Burkholderia multivorans]MDR8951277.1 hypothetical protein [Burkholderia multivorans]MDR8987684.1 hypothetical protein [Burkholderia multivorans]MDR9048451.1 hypothetical protein [Burkholderia multivorans]
MRFARIQGRKLQLPPVGVEVDQACRTRAHFRRIRQLPCNAQTPAALIRAAVAAAPVDRYAARQRKVRMRQHLLPRRQIDRVRADALLRAFRAVGFGHRREATGIAVRHADRRRLQVNRRAFQMNAGLVDRHRAARPDQLRLFRARQAALARIRDAQLVGVRARYRSGQLRREVGRRLDRIRLIGGHGIAHRLAAHGQRIGVPDIGRPVLHDAVGATAAHRACHLQPDVAQVQPANVDVVGHPDVKHRAHAHALHRRQRHGLELVAAGR